MTERLKAGPASPEVLRQKLKEEAARTSAERTAERAATPAVVKKAKKKRPLLDRGQQLRKGPDGKTIKDVIDEAVVGAKGAHPDY